ncbi:response regulator receiver and unknown domain protein [Thermosinus carboxydivorans Nor1]|uniref:Transcriptional regulatory protein n=1 Tax=Thermosinus carboxydivorans Nor1 TaxID=401526 RepID=A1HPP5_9FIRM|nr:response regulator [Thermosinus carboxydivorans]EAX48015.1 response regulator receiver and unknown domain protein [Thermosinus carboxydivorans Nor1]
MIRVLIVEDDPMVAELNRRYLAQVDGFELAAVARTGDEALTLLKEQKVDLVLLDIFMPGMNGLEFLAKIRAANERVDVILVTAARDCRSIQTALNHGAVDYLIKPFEFERLQQALQAYRQRVKLMRSEAALNQQDLDEQIFYRGKAVQPDLPKGLDRNTLGVVWEAIMQTDGPFTTDEMAKTVGISRVSMRKYLEFLRSQAVLKVELDYGSVGRPTNKYRCINRQAKFSK